MEQKGHTNLAVRERV